MPLSHQLLDALVSNGTLSMSDATNIQLGTYAHQSTLPIRINEPIQQVDTSDLFIEFANPFGF